MCNGTHMLLVMRKDVMRLPFTNVQFHPQTVGQRKGCDDTAFHKTCNVTHSLLVIATDAMRLHSTKTFNLAYILSVIGENTWISLSETFAMLPTSYLR